MYTEEIMLKTTYSFCVIIVCLRLIYSEFTKDEADGNGLAFMMLALCVIVSTLI